LTNNERKIKIENMDTTTKLAAAALGKRAAEVRHAKLKEQGVDISTYYSELRKKGLKNGKNKPKKKT